MKILFGSYSCSDRLYENLFKNSKKKTIIPTQKYFRMMLEGLANNPEIDIQCLTILPISRKTNDKFFWMAKNEKAKNNLKYHYIFFINIKYVKQICTILNCFLYTFFWCIKNKKQNAIVLVDSLIWPIAIPMAFASKICGVKRVSYLTDLPQYSNPKIESNNSVSFWSKKSLQSINKSNGFVFVTKKMHEVIDNGTPYIVNEGCIERKPYKHFRVKKTKRVLLYAGAVYKKYGINNLVDAFVRSQIDAELYIYGDGDYVNELMKIEKQHTNVHYCGCVSPSMIFEIEQNADVLINPRPTIEDYTKYSFPSKIIEYISTGVPVMSTRLLGIPDEYENLIYWIDDFSIEGIQMALKQMMSKKDEELFAFGKHAKEYCDTHKNSTIIGKKLVAFLEAIITEE